MISKCSKRSITAQHNKMWCSGKSLSSFIVGIFYDANLLLNMLEYMYFTLSITSTVVINLVVCLSCLLLYSYNVYFYDAFLTMLIPTHPVNFIVETGAPGLLKKRWPQWLLSNKSEARIKLPTSKVKGGYLNDPATEAPSYQFLRKGLCWNCRV